MRNERPDQSESNGIDALIDDAARRLVAGEPSSALRIGVRDRIGHRRSAWWGFAPALVAAAMVIVAIVGRGWFSASGGSDSVHRVTAHVSHPAPAVTSQPAASAPTQLAQSRLRQLSRRRAAVTPPPVEEESLIPPISIEPLTTAQIAVEQSSGVTPIEIAPLQIEPLLGQ